ncbi:MAG: hypothetical protein RR998_07940 [Oscillospiraceae bacterium]
MNFITHTSFACYIDPAATSYIIQVFAGIVISLGVFLGIFWKKIKIFFRERKIERLDKKLSKKQDNR